MPKVVSNHVDSTNTFLVWVFSLSLVGFPLVSSLPVILGVSSRLFTVPFRALVLAGSVACISRALPHVRERRIPAGVVLLVLVLALEAMRLLWDSAAADLPLDLPWGDYALLFFGGSLLPALALCQPLDVSVLRRSARICEALGMLAIVLVLVAVLLGALHGGPAFWRLSTEVLNPISLGHLAVTVVACNVYGLMVDDARGVSFAARLLGRGFSVLVCLAVLAGTGSRGPVVALAVVMLAAAVPMIVRSPRLLLVAAVPIAVLVALGQFTASLSVPGVQRLTNFGQDQSSLQRMQLFDGALRQFADHPLLGSAMVEYSQRIYAHNIVLDAMMALGIFGAALLLILLWLSVVHAGRLLLAGVPEYVWLGALFLQYLVDSMLSGSVAFSLQFWICTAAIWGVGVAKSSSGTGQLSRVEA